LILWSLLWRLYRLVPKGAPGDSFLLWPGKQAAAFILLGTVYAYLVWQSISRSQPDRRRRAVLAALVLACFGLADWALLAALPRLDLSFGPLAFPLIAITAVRLAIFTILTLILYALNKYRSSNSSTGGRSVDHIKKLLNTGMACLWLANSILMAVEVDGLYVEPFAIQTTELYLSGPSKASGEPLRIVHLTDLHVERITRRELDLIQQVKALQPDLILLTGDYVNADYLNDPQTLHDTRSVLAQLSAPYGVYAITGSVDGPHVMDQVFTDLPIIVLRDQVHKLRVGSQEIDLIGVSDFGATRDGQRLSVLMQQVPQGAYSILLYHTPDLAEVADQLQIDLYLAGHTHGGQIRLPLWGAIVTLSAFNKRYEAGLYPLNPTMLYVSRGIGLEGLSFPRARFLCPPEIVVIDLGNGASQ
jgi:predicted MPP superfamily phosphohydrolase